MFDEYNSYAKLYRMVRDKTWDKRYVKYEIENYRKNRVWWKKAYICTTSDVAALIVGDFDVADFNRDIIIEQKTSILKHVSILNTAYLTLQFIVWVWYSL
jgi:hypothetical protein